MNFCCFSVFVFMGFELIELTIRGTLCTATFCKSFLELKKDLNSFLDSCVHFCYSKEV